MHHDSAATLREVSDSMVDAERRCSHLRRRVRWGAVRAECVIEAQGAHSSARKEWRVVIGDGRGLCRAVYQPDRASHSRRQAEAADFVGNGGAVAVNGGQVSGWYMQI